MKRSTRSTAPRGARGALPPVRDREVDEICAAVREGRCCTFIGPAHHQKTAMMLEATRVIGEWEGYAALYVSLRGIRAQMEADFFDALRRRLAAKIWRYYRCRLPAAPVRSPNALKRFFLTTVENLRVNLVLLVDDLDAMPEYVRELLLLLRASYQSTAAPTQLLAVVCSSNNLVRTAFGSTSPFEPISRRILVRDLNPTETRACARARLTEYEVQPTPRALEFIHALTAGDRFLVHQLTNAGARRVKRAQRRQLSVADLKRAAQHLVEHDASGALAEGMRQFESDVNLCKSILLLNERGSAPISELLFDLRENPDPFTASGFAVNEQGVFRIKSELHRRLLHHYFTNEHVGRIFLAAGQWSEALDYLQRDLEHDPAGTRARVMLAAANAIYAVPDLQAAYCFLVRGLELAYPDVCIQLYMLNQDALARVYPPSAADGVADTMLIPLRERSRVEIRALDHPHPFWLQPRQRQTFDLFLPLRPNPQSNLGLLTLSSFIQPKNYSRHQELLAGLVSYVGHIARALQERVEYDRLNRAATRRADDLQQLLLLMRELMSTREGYEAVLSKVLQTAQQALGTRAQRGSIYIFNRVTGLLEMRVGLGYPREMWGRRVFRPGEGIAGEVFQTGKLINVANAANEPRYVRFEGEPEPPAHSMIGVPLAGKDAILGVLFLDNLKRTNAFDAESERLLELFAGQVALWLESMELLERLDTRQRWSNLALYAAHQIKKPLAWAQKAAERVRTLSREEAWKSSLRKQIDRLFEDLAHSSQGLDWIFRYVRLNAPNFSVVNLSQVMSDKLAALREHCPRGIRLVPLPSNGKPATANADPELIGMLIENMVENSLEALGKDQAGEVVVEVQVEGALCVMRFRDTGPGIKPERRERIFERGESSKPREAFGRGWGLAFCREIAAAHYGTLKYDDNYTGQGAAFVLCLPWIEPVA